VHRQAAGEPVRVALDDAAAAEALHRLRDALVERHDVRVGESIDLFHIRHIGVHEGQDKPSWTPDVPQSSLKGGQSGLASTASGGADG
jgi:hypothetical protein